MKRLLSIIIVLALVMTSAIVPAAAETTGVKKFEKDELGVWHYYIDDVQQYDKYAVNTEDHDLLYYFANEENNGKGSIYTGVYEGKYYENGLLFTGTRDGKYYSVGVLFTGTRKDNGKYYSKGVLFTGYVSSKFYKSGVLQKNVKTIIDSSTKKAYKCDKTGKATAYNGVYNGTYYNKSGSPVTTKSRKKLVKFDSAWYYVNKSGKVYMPAKSGAYVMDNGLKYYIYSTGKVKKVSKAAVYKVNGSLYYFYAGSNIRFTKKAHWWKRPGTKKTYRVLSTGRIMTGFFKLGKYKYYGTKTKGYVIQNRISTLGGNKYWFDKKGRVVTSKWRKKNGKKYQYFNRYGIMAQNKAAYVGKYKYYFSKSGVVQTDLFKYKGMKWVKKQTVQVAVNRKKNVITFYAKDGKKGYTIPLYSCLCSVGTDDHPTPVEITYTSPARTHRWMILGGPHINTALCYGQYVVNYNGRRYFHSCCYNSKNIRNLVTYNYNMLGKPASHGCIRMRAVDAKRLYDLAKVKRLQVKVYSSSTAGPFGKPKYKKIPAGQKYDPTDPNL